MSDRKQTGEVCVKKNTEVEWTIRNIFSYTAEDERLDSPGFDVSGSRWYLSISPNGVTRSNSVGWIALYLIREDDKWTPKKGANYTFGVKRADGTVEALGKDIIWVFSERGEGYGQPALLLRSELLRRKSELAPSDALTVTCSLWVIENHHSFARTDKFSQNFSDLLASKKNCDATLKVKQEEFPVHKLILSARSPVFAAMFEADMQEKQTGVVEIDYCDPEAFKDFLAYLYSGNADNLPSNACRIADKYDVKELRSACLLYIMLNLTPDNVLDAAVLGRQFSEDALKVKSQYFFNQNFGKIVFTAKWDSFLESNLLLANELLKKMGADMK